MGTAARRAVRGSPRGRGTLLNPDDVVVEHDPAAHQFYARLNGMRAVLEYRRAPGKIVFVHTEVPAAFQHHGVADALAHAGLEYARKEHLAVDARCPFVASYISRHPEYQREESRKP